MFNQTASMDYFDYKFSVGIVRMYYILNQLHKSIARLLIIVIYMGYMSTFILDFVIIFFCIYRTYQKYLRKVQLNKMLMAAASICAASFLVQPSIASSVMKDIHLSVNIHPSDTAIISAIIISHLDPNSENVS